MRLKDKLISLSEELAFIDIGFAKVEPLDKEIEVYKKWLDSGKNATMQWMERNLEKRQNPSQLVTGAKTVIILLYNYYTGKKYSESKEFGKISRYAWNYDYHDIILPKLRKLENLIKEEFPNSNNRSYVDTGPILEKVWAEKAGVGWQGKNSLLISKKYGSYVFLGTIITSVEFECLPQVKDYCGTCTKCIDACPTDAIVEDKIVDSNKCISYWTIEAKADSEIPEEISQNSNNWIFGCDICQEVCPWNRHKPKITDDLDFFPRNNETELSKEFILNLSQEEFSGRFRKSPIKRTKIAGLKRNISMIQK